MSPGENMYPVANGTKSRLTSAYTQKEVNYYLVAAVAATIATVCLMPLMMYQQSDIIAPSLLQFLLNGPQ
jgi:hypothetical protein